MADVPTAEEIVALAAEGGLGSEIARRFGLRENADLSAVVECLVALHNTGRLDLLQLVASGALQAMEGPRFFAASNFLCRALPKIDAPVSAMMVCIDTLVTSGGNDAAAGLPNAAFRTWCALDVQRAREVLVAACGGDPLAIRRLPFALEAMKDLDEARRVVLEFDDDRRLAAIEAVGRTPDPDGRSREKTFAVFGEVLDGDTDDVVRAGLLIAAVSIVAQSGAAPPEFAIALLRRVCEAPGDQTLHQAAYVLWAHEAAMRADVVEILLSALAGVNPKNKGTLNELDLGLQAILTTIHGDAAVAFVTNLMIGPVKDVGLGEFSGFMRSLLDGPIERLSPTVVSWLQIGSVRLCEDLAAALRRRDRDQAPMTLRPQDLAITSTAQIFICRKAIGYFFLQPVTAASVLVAVLGVCDDTTAEAVQGLLVEPLLLNYGGVRSYLASIPADHPAKARVGSSLAANEAYLAAVRAMPDVVELQPSEHHKRIERLLRSDQMRAAHKRAESESVFLNLVTRSTLIYGNRSLSFIKGPDAGLRAMEMDLHPIEVSFEYPRMEFVDPVGLDYTLRVFRVERLAS